MIWEYHHFRKPPFLGWPGEGTADSLDVGCLALLALPKIRLQKATVIKIRNAKKLVNTTPKCCKAGEQETFDGWIDPSAQIDVGANRR